MSTDERLARLPQWAQSEITLLRQDNAALRQRLTVGPGDSDTFLIDYGTGTETPLGTGVRVMFRHERPVLPGHIDARQMAPGVVEVYSDEPLWVQCQSSNVFRVHARQAGAE